MWTYTVGATRLSLIEHLGSTETTYEVFGTEGQRVVSLGRSFRR
jgi:hypothetical protein